MRFANTKKVAKKKVKTPFELAKFYIQWLIADGVWEAMPSDEKISKRLRQNKQFP